MSRILGVDRRESHLRLVLLDSAGKKLSLLDTAEVSWAEFAEPVEAYRAAMASLGPKAARPDAVVLLLESKRCFIHPLSLPRSVERRLNEVVPFELEALLPLDFEEVVFDYELQKSKEKDAPLELLTVSARKTHVQELISGSEEGLGLSPDRVGCAGLALGLLAETTPPEGAMAILDLGVSSSELVILEQGELRAARTLNVGSAQLIAQLGRLCAQLRQSFAAHTAKNEALGRSSGQVQLLRLTGEGLEGDSEQLRLLVSGLEKELAIDVGCLPAPAWLTASPALRERFLPFARAIAAGVLSTRPRGNNLRRGELAFSRGLGFLKDKLPLLSFLMIALLLSFGFRIYAQGQQVGAQREGLEKTLLQLTRETFGEETAEPDEAQGLLERFQSSRPEDPMPYLDGFGVMVALSEKIPQAVTHDVEQLEYTKGKVNLRGIVGSTEDTQKVAKALSEHECFHEVKVSKISQVVNSEKVRYMLEANVRCPEDRVEEKKAKKPVSEESAQ